MPNFKKHAETGALVGSVAGLAINLFVQLDKVDKKEREKVDWLELFLSTAVGGAIGTIGGVLPDLLEPAYHSHHRKLFHSVTAAGAVSYGIYKTHQSDLSKETKGVITTMGIGYLSHLLLDSETPRGLPLIT